MSSPSIRVTGSPYFESFLDDYHRPSKARTFCSVCCNLSPGTAYHLLPRSDIAYYDYPQGQLNFELAKSNGLYDESEPVPSWAGKIRIDYSSFQITAVFQDLVKSASQGCASCKILMSGLIKLNKTEIREDSADIELDVLFCRGDVLQVTVYRYDAQATEEEESWDLFGPLIPTSKNRSFFGKFDFYTLPGLPSPWPTIGSIVKYEDPHEGSRVWFGGQTRHITESLSVSAATDLAKAWLKQCLSTHPLCKELAAASGRSLPKRVIDVGKDDNANIHLFETQVGDLRSIGTYVALSHCWGLSQHIVSTKSTIETWKQNIPWNELPRTFQDAIVMTRSLDIHYIWIDSLCIVQDDAQDWEIEAAKMGKIYNEAFLVITATSSIDGDGGLFFPRPSYITISGVDRDQNSFHIFARPYIGHVPFTWGPGANEELVSRYEVSAYDPEPEFPLLTRAWCFQERLLGTRILHFTRNEMVFECLTSVDCECGAMKGHYEQVILPLRRYAASESTYQESNDTASPFDDMSRYQRDSVLVYKPVTDTALAIPALSFKDSFPRWRALVAEYSTKSITHRTDWLPALAGLASRWHRGESGVYLAGIWGKDILRSLLWKPGSSISKVRNPSDAYVAPSWSWASVVLQVVWIKPGQGSSSSFIEIDESKSGIIPSTHDIFGAVKSGWLCITGSVTEFKFLYLWPDSNRATLEKDQHTASFLVDDREKITQKPGDTVIWLRLCQDGPHERAMILASVPRQHLSGLPSEVQEFPIVYKRIGIVEYVSKDLELQDLQKTTMYII